MFGVTALGSCLGRWCEESHPWFIGSLVICYVLACCHLGFAGGRPFGGDPPAGFQSCCSIGCGYNPRHEERFKSCGSVVHLGSYILCNYPDKFILESFTKSFYLRPPQPQFHQYSPRCHCSLNH